MRFDPIRAGPYHCDMFDLLITNGTVVDGTGADRRIADIAITDGRIVAVGTDLGDAHEVIDAEGLLVTPGFVDVHSHYDGQATWTSCSSRVPCMASPHSSWATVASGSRR